LHIIALIVSVKLFLFAAAYSQRDIWERKALKSIIYAPAILSLAYLILRVFFAFTSVEIFEYQINLIQYVVMLIITLIASYFILIIAWETEERIYKKQAITIFVASIFGGMGGFLHTFWGIHITLSYIVVIAILAFALIKLNFLDIIPIVKKKIFLNMKIPLVILDESGFVAHQNPFCKEKLPLFEVGKNLKKHNTKFVQKIDEMINFDKKNNFSITYNKKKYHVKYINIKKGEKNIGKLLFIMTPNMKKNHKIIIEEISSKKIEEFISQIYSH